MPSAVSYPCFGNHGLYSVQFVVNPNRYKPAQRRLFPVFAVNTHRQSTPYLLGTWKEAAELKPEQQYSIAAFSVDDATSSIASDCTHGYSSGGKRQTSSELLKLRLAFDYTNSSPGF